jgi:dTDP-4-dehydrorhamnose reductase
MNAMNKKHKIIQTDIHNLNIACRQDVFNLAQHQKPDFIINCAAYTNVDGCESNENQAFSVNAIGAQNLSIAANKIGAGIMQISTDYVFDGRAYTPFREYDPVNPQNCYGRSKALGEALVRETNPRHYIVRTAWLYGNGNNFVRTMLRLAKSNKKVDVVGDQIGSPTNTADLAKCIINLLETELYGTYHATCEGECSWYTFAKRIFELKGIVINVNKITTDQLQRPAKRPRYTVLDNYMLKLIDLNTFRHWEDALEEYLYMEERKDI